MRGLKILFFMMMICPFSSLLYADIYEWTDENGVQHFTNYPPPDGARIFMKSNEIKYDEAADRERMEAERQAQLALRRLEIERREAELEQREAEVERKLAEASRASKETLPETEEYPDNDGNDRHHYQSFGYFSHYPYRYNNRPYYRNENHSIFFTRDPKISRSEKNRIRNFYRYDSSKAKVHPRNHHPRSRAEQHPSKYSIQSRKSAFYGRHY